MSHNIQKSESRVALQESVSTSKTFATIVRVHKKVLKSNKDPSAVCTSNALTNRSNVASTRQHLPHKLQTRALILHAVGGRGIQSERVLDRNEGRLQRV